MVKKIILAHNIPLIKKGFVSVFEEMSRVQCVVGDYTDFSQAKNALVNADKGDVAILDVLSWLTMTNQENYAFYEHMRSKGLLFCVVAFQVQSRISRLRMRGICAIIELEAEIHDVRSKLRKLMSATNNMESGTPFQAGKEGLLTDRQVEILELMADGLTNKQIASYLHIDVTTVKAHVSEVLKKLHCKKRSHAVAVYASKGGLGWDILKAQI